MALQLGETWTLLQTRTGVAEYSTEQAHTGSYSVKLATPVYWPPSTPTPPDWIWGDQGRVRFFGQGETLSEVMHLSYWSYVATPAQGNDRIRPWIAIYLDDDGMYFRPDGLPDWEYYLQAEPVYATATHDAPGNLANLGAWEYWDAYDGAHPLHWISAEYFGRPYEAPHLQDYISGAAMDWLTRVGVIHYASIPYGDLEVISIDFRAGYGGTWNGFIGYVDDVTINEHIVSFESLDILESLKAEIGGVPDGDFKPPAADRKAALIDKINDVIAKIDAGDYKGAIMKLNMDIRPKLDADAKQSWLVIPHLELLAKIDTVVGILKGLL